MQIKTTMKEMIKCQNATYRLIQFIGQGNYGIVYEAENIADKSRVAIKLPADNKMSYSTEEKEKIYSKIREEISFLKKD